MIQFNLLPDVKVRFIKARKAKHTVITVSVLSMAISMSLLAIMVSASLFQKHHINTLNNDIESKKTALNNTTDLSKILTIQNQLNTLPSLYSQRPVTSRLAGYLQATTPTQISLTQLDVDFSTNIITVSGKADSLVSVNQYVDTLKFTDYTYTDTDGNKAGPTNAFTQVVLTSFDRTSSQATFGISMNFSKDIFDSAKKVTLNVPKTITTRSETELPGAVFDSQENN